MHADEHKSRKSLIIALLVTVFFMLFEFFGGMLSNSMALISDAGHMLTDSTALIMALLAFWIARRASGNAEKTFGYYRLEILSALANGVILVVIAFFVFWGAIARLYEPVPINTGIMMVVAVVGLLANLFSIFVLSPHSGENLNIKGAFWHVSSDALSSVAAIAGALIIWLTGFKAVDPILSIIIGILIIKGACDIICEAVEILMEAAPQDIRLEDVVKSLKEIEGVKDLHHVHIWTITSGYRALSAHVEIEDVRVSQCGNLLQKINDMLSKKYDIEHATLQFECERCEGGLVCERKD